MQHRRDYEAIHLATLLHFKGKQQYEFTAEDRHRYATIYDGILEKSIKLYNEKHDIIWHIQHALHTQIYASKTDGADYPDGKFSQDEAWRCFSLSDKKDKIVIW
jgi:hypothetical protein